MSKSAAADRFQTRKFSDIAGEILRERIMSGALSPGSRLNEVVLSEELRISRPPLREALRVLSGEGLVRLIPGRGAFVTDLDAKAVEQVAEIREALECASARLAAERATPTELARLQAVMDQAEAHLRDPGMPYPHHTDFHTALAAAAGNPRLADALEEVVRQLRLASMRTNEDPARARQVLLEHRAIVAGVLERDAAAAERAMRDHIRASTRAMVALLENQ